MPSLDQNESVELPDTSVSRFGTFTSIVVGVTAMLSMIFITVRLGVFAYFLVVAISFFIASERHQTFSQKWWYGLVYPSVLWCSVIYLANKW